MATRKKEAAGTAPAAATEQASQATTAQAAPAIVLPGEGAPDEGQAAIVAALEFAQQPGQLAAAVAGALGTPTLDIDAQEGSVTSESALLPGGDLDDSEMVGRTVLVQSRSARGRWRIGRHFTTEPSPVAIDELTEDEVGRLLADPELIVSLDD